MIVKVKSILLYIYYRTINSYYEEDLKFHKNVGGDVNYAKGETLVWLSFNAHIYFLVCDTCHIQNRYHITRKFYCVFYIHVFPN